MNSRAVLILFLFVLWSLGSGWFYVVQIKEAYPPKEVVETKIEYPVSFLRGSSEAILGSSFETYKESLLTKLDSNEVLEIVGLYSEKEEYLDSVSNLGMERAHNFRLLFPSIAESSISYVSKTSEFADSIGQFEAVRYNVLVNSTYVQETPRGAVLYFPGAAKANLFNAKTKAYLLYLATEHKESVIDLTGHVYTEEPVGENYSAGLKLATEVQTYLINLGMSSYQVSAMSKGDTSLQNNEDTRRRVEVLINK